MRFLIANRFLRSKYNTSFINMISKISVIGIILGVAILITVLSVMNGFEKELRTKILGFTSHVTIYPKNNSQFDHEKLYSKLVENKDVAGHSPYIQREVMITSSTGTVNAYFRAVMPNSEKDVSIVDNNIILGNFNDLSIAESNIIIGQGIAANLSVGIYDNIELLTQLNFGPDNKYYQFRKNYKVVGIYDVGLFEYNNAYVFINLNEFIKDLEKNNKRGASLDAISIKLNDPLKAYNFSYDFNLNSDDYFSQDWSHSHRALFSAINNEKRVMFIILMLIVMIAAFNIISSLLMLVINKQKDIAILMTLGATKSTIITIFILQGLFLGLLGTVFGVILGIILSSNIDIIVTSIESIFNLSLMPAEIYHLTKIPSIIDYDDLFLIGIFTFIITLSATIYPAIKAAGILPHKVFRGGN